MNMVDSNRDEVIRMNEAPPTVARRQEIPNFSILKSGYRTYLLYDADDNYLGTTEEFDPSRIGVKNGQPSTVTNKKPIIRFIPAGSTTIIVTDRVHKIEATIEAPDAFMKILNSQGAFFADSNGKKPNVSASVTVFSGDARTSFTSEFSASVNMANGASGTITFSKSQRLADLGPGKQMFVASWVGNFTGFDSNGKKLVFEIPEFDMRASSVTDLETLYEVERDTSGKLKLVQNNGVPKIISAEEIIAGVGVDNIPTPEELKSLLFNAEIIPDPQIVDSGAFDPVNVKPDQSWLDEVPDLLPGEIIDPPVFNINDFVNDEFEPFDPNTQEDDLGIEGSYSAINQYDGNGNLVSTGVTTGDGVLEGRPIWTEIRINPDGSKTIFIYWNIEATAQPDIIVDYSEQFFTKWKQGFSSEAERDAAITAEAAYTETQAQQKARLEAGINKEQLKKDILQNLTEIIKSTDASLSGVQYTLDIPAQTIFGVPVQLPNGDVKQTRQVYDQNSSSYRTIDILWTDHANFTDPVTNETTNIAHTIIESERLDNNTTLDTITKLKNNAVSESDTYVAEEVNSTVANDVAIRKVTSFDENGVIIEETTDVFFEGTNISFGQIGSIFGSTIGRQLTDDPLGSIALGTVLGAIGQNLAQIVGASAFGNKTLNDAVDLALDDFGLDLKAAGVGAISSFLVGQLLNEIGLDGTVGEVVNTFAGTALTTVATNIAGGASTAGDIFAGVNPANIIGGFIGSKLASEVISTDTVGGSILASAGGAVGGYIGSIFLPGIGTAIGSFVGQVSGALIAKNPFIAFGLFGFTGLGLHLFSKLLGGGEPESGADVEFDNYSNKFRVGNVWSKHGGSEEIVISLASSASRNLNAIIELIGGEVVNKSQIDAGNFGAKKDKITYVGPRGSLILDSKDEFASSSLIEHGVLNTLKDVQIVGGDIYFKRALYGSIDLLMNGNSVDFSVRGEAIGTLTGNFDVAENYRNYVENASVINAFIKNKPESTFAAGWIATLIRAGEVGLNKRHSTDWQGLGFEDWADANNVNGIPSLEFYSSFNLNRQSDRVVIHQDSNRVYHRIYDTIIQEDKDVIEGTSGADTITINDDILTGNMANTINGGISDGSDFNIEIAASIYGDGGDDIIQGGDLGNDIFGGVGDDTITGGNKDDWIFGDAGNDTLNTGGGSGNYISGGAGHDILYEKATHQTTGGVLQDIIFDAYNAVNWQIVSQHLTGENVFLGSS